MEGLKLAASYSWNCNTAKRLKVCEKLLGFILNGENCKVAKEILEALIPYRFYSAIAQANELSDAFSPEVVSFYWRGWPATFKSPRPDTGFFHNHTVAAIAYSQPLKKIELNHMNECLAACGRIKQVGKNYFVIKYLPVVRKKNGLFLGKPTKTKITNHLKLKAKTDNFASFHYANAAEIISPAEAERLTEITEEILQNFNAKRK